MTPPEPSKPTEQRLRDVLSYCDSPERQGYPTPLPEFRAIVQNALDCRAQLAAAEAEAKLAALRGAGDHLASALSPGLGLSDTEKGRRRLHWVEMRDGTIPIDWRARALEAEAKCERLRAAILWALGENGEFGDEPPPIAGRWRQRFWWRSELRQRAALERP